MNSRFFGKVIAPMTPLEALRELQSRPLVTAGYGESCDVELLPGMVAAEIDACEEYLGAPLPRDIRELMTHAAGFELDGDELAWHGHVMGPEFREAFPCSICVMEDGHGNGWCVDIDRAAGKWGPVYYICQDPAVVVRQADSLAEFILQFAEQCTKPERTGSLQLVADRLVNKVWDLGGVTMDSNTLRESTDDVLRRIAEHADDGVVCDLRRARTGDGFAWGRFGPRTIVTRLGHDPVWSLQRPIEARKWWNRWA